MAAERAPILDDDPNLLQEWIKNGRRRMLHVVYRVGDLDNTIKLYTECLGMKLLRQRDILEERYRNAFFGYGPEESNFSVELTYNYGVNNYEIGSGFGHFGVAVDDVSSWLYGGKMGSFSTLASHQTPDLNNVKNLANSAALLATSAKNRRR